MYGFPQSMRVRARGEFQRAFDGGIKVVGPGLVLIALPRPEAERSGGSRLGLVVSRKVGNAVTRNRIKRRLRENFRVLQPELRRSTYLNAVDLIVVARGAISRASSEDIARELDHGLTRLARQLGRRKAAAQVASAKEPGPLKGTGKDDDSG